jgi:hypothetical protein
MRKVALGAAPVRGNWTPKFKLRRKQKAKEEDTEQKKTPFVSYHPTVKGQQRVEPLRKYFHRDMALLLDAWPHVESWTGNAASIKVQVGGKDASFTPDFLVEERSSSYALRLRSGNNKTSRAGEDYYSAVRENYERRGMSLEIITRAEVESHPDLPAAVELFYHRYRDWPENLPFDVAALAEERHLPTIGSLHVAMGGDKEAWAMLLSLVSHGYVIADIQGKLGPDTPVLACRTKGWRT